MKSWDLNVAFRVIGENLKEHTLRSLLYCDLAVLRLPMSTCELFIIKCEKDDIYGLTAITVSGKYVKIYRNLVYR